MTLEAYAPLCCVAVAAVFGALMYVAVVASYRRRHEGEIERKQRQRRRPEGE